MPSITTRRNAAGALDRLVRARLDSVTFRHEAVAILQQAVGFDAWCWTLMDPGSGLPSHAMAENPVITGEQARFFQVIFQSEDVPLGIEPGGGTSRVHSLREATGGDLPRSARWREVLGPGGYGDELAAGLIAGGLCWGHLALYRDVGQAAFGREDTEFLAQVVPGLAARLRQVAREPAESWDEADEPGTLLLDRDLRLLAATPQAPFWIDELARLYPRAVGRLPAIVYALAARLGVQPGVGAGRSARVRLRTPGGRWLAVSASTLSPTAASMPRGVLAVTIGPPTADEIASLLMHAWGLSAREREVARLLLGGRGTEDIAIGLTISLHTVRDHVRSLFQKVGVGSRRELVAALNGQSPDQSGSPQLR
ncbi:MAG: helix-turn-helix transcriptional regulator [Candidatus Dormibacteraeota bacterium]|nr:helix-turn-helix transcriptional regulator [Candidatus Dormibacteraeota bacterium]